MPVIGVIEPGARAAVAARQRRPHRRHRHRRHGRERRLRARHLTRSQPDAQVIQRACPLFVPLVEEGWFDHPATELIAREYLTPLREAGVGALVLGCTHYPLLKPLLQRVMGPRCADRQRRGDGACAGDAC